MDSALLFPFASSTPRNDIELNGCAGKRITMGLHGLSGIGTCSSAAPRTIVNLRTNQVDEGGGTLIEAALSEQNTTIKESRPTLSGWVVAYSIWNRGYLIEDWRRDQPTVIKQVAG